ncbi:synaptojanin-2-binding protein-like [Babylonia areolata]|uniref:synaptojanin-2-binding protein-like n=1 Tax=Babylonia areolata TaxID=304850 RepID=UPI003FD49742
MPLNLPVNTFVLERGDTGLGFNIRGGTDIPHVPGDNGIFVTRLKEDGAAFRDGRLKEGDKILAVNGKSIENVTHNEAVQIFITAGNTVELKVQHGAYAELMRQRTSGEDGGGGGAGGNFKVLGAALTVLAIVGVGLFLFMRQQPPAE